MVAIVSGNTLGLNLTSKGVVGDQGVAGDPTHGQGGEQVYVNAATGNLVMRQLQDELVGAGLDVSSVLTYNSLGLATDDNADNFSLGKVSAQLALTGTVNSAGSTLTRTAFDGSRSVYTWNASSARYQCLNGAGAFDSITYATGTSQYTWVDGSTQTKETYDGTTKRLLTRSDAAGNKLTFGYDVNGQLTTVTDANGEVVTYVYSGNKLMAINAPVTNPTTYAVATQQVVSYGYDTSNRLKTVTVDLSPDGSTADGNVYVTSFTYGDSSTRIQTMQQTDGTQLTFAYDASQRVKTITDALSNVTSFTYDTANHKTSVTANGQTTVYAYDATTGLLTTVAAPAVNGVSALNQYVYNANGQLTSFIDGDGRTTTYGYDAAGNQTSVLDAAGNLTTRTYDAQNRLLSQAISTLAQPALVGSANMSVGAGALTKTGSSVGWDAAVRSVNSISGAATVSFTAGSPANHVMVGLNSDPDTDNSFQSIDYAIYLQAGTLAVYSNGNFVSTIGSYVQGDNLSLAYDGSGHVTFNKNGQALYSMAATVTQPLYVDTSFYEPGSSISKLTFGTGQSTVQTTRYVYSADGKGLLRFLISPAGRVTQYDYDAAGAVTGQSEYVANTYNAGPPGSPAPTEAQLLAWRASQDLTKTIRTEYTRGADEQLLTTRTFVAAASNGAGVVDATTRSTSTLYDKRGDLLKQQTGAPVTTFVVDGLGRVTSQAQSLLGTTTTAHADASNRITVNLTNGLLRTETLDNAGRVLSSVDTFGGVTQASTTYAYDAAGHVLRSTDATGVSTWALFDADGRKDADIDATGAMTEYVYDNANQITRTIAYATPVNTALLVDGNGVPSNPAIATIRPTTSTADHARWSVYDADGRLLQSIDATGAVTQYAYDGAGQLTTTCQFATLINVATLGNSPSALTMAAAAGDRITSHYYDADGHLTGTLDPDHFLTEYQYDGAGQRTATIRYATASSVTTASTLAQARPPVSPSDATSVTLYDLEGRVTGQIDPTGALTATYYNADGTIDHTTICAARVTLPVAAGTNVASIAVATPGADRTTSYTYDADARVHTMTDPVGTVTTYTYDAGTSNVVSTAVTSALPGSATTQTKYDALGHVIATLDGVGSAAIASGSLSATAAWAQYSTSYTYDLAGRRASMTDALGNKTLYFYDADGHLRYTVSPKNEVQELRYDAFGNVTVRVSYAGTINPAGIGAGGLVTTGLTGAVAAVANATLDQINRYAYDQDGRQIFAVDPAGAVTQTGYDALGNVVTRTQYATPIDLPTAGSVDGKTLTLSGDAGGVTGANYATIDPTHTYTVTARMRQLSGVGSVYVGVVTRDANGNMITNAGYGGTFAYCSAVGSGLTPDMGWVTYTGSISGTQTTTAGVGSVTNKFYAGSAQATPLILYNYYGSNGDPGRDVEIDSLTLTDTTTNTVLNIDPSLINGASSLAMMSGAVESVQSSATASLTADQIRARLRLNATADHTTRYAYDQDGRQIFAVDPTGAVTQTSYDALGNVVTRTQYATPIDLPTAGSVDGKTLTLSGDAGGVTGANYATIDPTHTYTVTARMRQLSGVGSVYVGVVTRDANGNIITNAGNGGTFTYCAAVGTGLTPDMGWVTYTGSISGTQPNAAGGTIVTNKFLAGSAQASPLILYNYYGTNGDPGRDVEIDSLTLTDTTTNTVLNIDPSLINGASSLAMMSGAVESVQSSATATLTADQIRARLRLNAASDSIATYEYNTNSQVVYSADSLGHATRTVYDAAGRPVYATAPDGAVTRNDYDADGRVIRTTTFANKLTAANLSSLPHAVAASQVASLIVAKPGSDAVLATQYDSFGRVRYTMDGTGAISERRYDADGNVVDSIAYATRIDPLTWSASSPPSVVTDAVRDRHVHASYDTFGRVIAQSDGTGAVIVNTYDADGHLTDRLRYATRIAPGSWTAGQIPTITASADDIHERYAYDALGRLTYSADGTGAVTGYLYDANGNVTQKTLFAASVTAVQALGTVALTPGGDRVDRYGYDTFDRQVWHADPANALDYTGYDADGRVTQTIRYAQPNPGALPTTTAPLAFGGADRVVSNFYNALGELTFTVDAVNAVNAVTANTYFQDGRLQAQVRYATPITAGAAPTTVVANASIDQKTQYQYDAAGRIQQTTNPEGGTQTFAYDGLGNKISFTNEKSLTWTYAYDADSRLVSQTTPSVDVTVNGFSFGGHLVESQSVETLVTSFVFDGVGNLRSRTETSSGAFYARTTAYDYDGVGNQVSVTLPAVDAFDAHGVKIASAVAPQTTTLYDAFGNAVADIDAAQHVSVKSYDQANRLAYEVDGNGYVTYYARNAFGNATQVRRYNAAKTSLVSPVPANAAAVSNSARIKLAVGSGDSVNDRTLTNQYDSDGRITAVTSDAGYFYDFANGAANQAESGVRHVSYKIYDTFGELVQERDLLNATQGLYADTFHYFDNAGRETFTIDALGYLTERVIDVFGNVRTTIEYANATSGWGLNAMNGRPTLASVGATPDANGAYDRTTRHTYDRLNRKISEVRDLDFSTTDDGNTTGHQVTTSWGYDALGNVTRYTDALNNSTYNLYDGLGRLAAVESPGRANPVGGANLQPVVEYSYDVFGQQSAQRNHANSATGVGEFTGVWTRAAHPYAVANADASDKIIRTQYDAAGRVVHVDDALGTASYSEYTLDGRLAYTWHVVGGKTIWQGTTYDAVGQVLHVYSASPDTARAGQDTTTDYHYNAFGEVDQKGVDGGMQEFFSYNKLGQVWKTNTSGVVHVYLHDMQGRVSADIMSAGIGRDNVDMNTVTSEADADSRLDLRRTNTVYDKLGRALRTELPERSVATGGLGLNAGPVGWTVAAATGVNDSTVTFTWPSLSRLGTGDVKVWFAYTTKSAPNITPNMQAEFEGGQTTTGTSISLNAGGGGVAGVVSVAIYKKDTYGNWQQVFWQIAPPATGKTWGSAASYTSPNHSLIEIVAPPTTGAIGSQVNQTAGVKLTYQSAAMASPATATLANFGAEYGFDAVGLAAGTYNYTLTFTNPDGTTSAGPAGSFTIGSTLTNAAASLWSRPVVYQSVDRWGNVVARSDPDSAHWVTKYRYNANNQLVWQQQPDPAGTATAGPLTQIFYDQMGHQLATIDANLHLSGQLVDAAGNVIETDMHPAAGVLVKTTARYDIFGRKVLSTSGDGFDASTGAANAQNLAYTTQFTYDLNDHVTTAQHGIDPAGSVKVYLTTGAGSSLAATALFGAALQNLTEQYTYDEDGHRTASWDGTRSNASGHAALYTYYTYDVAGNLVTTAKPLLAGQTTSTATTTTLSFDDFGHKKYELDPDGNTETWQYDYFGTRMLAHKDLGGYLYSDTYDNAGQLTRQTNQLTLLSNAAQDQYRYYDGAGQLVRLWDAGTFVNTAYSYDLAGHKLTETTSSLWSTYQDNHLAYDTLGRLMDSSDSNVHVSFQYDAVGNRTHIKTTVVGTTARALNGDVTTTADHWFSYDGMNRQVNADWVNASVMGLTGHTLSYDADGNRKSDTFLGNKVTANGGDQVVTGYDEQGNPIYGTNPVTYQTSTANVTETYTYDTVDRLRETRYDGVFVDNRLYDGAGRTILEGPSGDLPTGYATALNQGVAADKAIGLETRINKYDEHGNVLATYAMKSDGTAEYSVDYSAGGTGNKQTGYDAVGNLRGSSITTYGSGAYTQSTYVQSYDIRESYQQTSQTTVRGTTTMGGTNTTYNNDGVINSVTDTKQASFNRGFISDIDGHVLSTISTVAKHEERELVVNGEVLGTYGVGVNPVTPTDGTGAAIYQQNAQFDFGFRPVTGNYPNASVGSYTVSAGDTLDSIATNAYGDSQQWWRIAQANGLGSNADLRVGTTVVIPNAASGTHNNATTFEPYDPSQIVGSTSPNMPAPAQPAHGGCGAVGMIIMIVVAVVATVFTAGAAAVGFAAAFADIGATMVAGASALLAGAGTLAGAALAAGSAAVGSVVSQGVGIAIKARRGFSWKEVATSAIGAGVTAGIPAVSSGIAGAMATAAIDSTVTQGIDSAVHLQKGFSWQNVAISAVSAGAGYEASQLANGAMAGFGDAISLQQQKIVSGEVSRFVSTATSDILRGGHMTPTRILTDAFGNALGSSVADAMMPVQNTPQENFRQSEIRDEDAAHEWHGIAQSDYILGHRLLDNEIAATQGQSVQRTFSEDTAYRTAQEQQQLLSTLGMSSDSASTSSVLQIGAETAAATSLTLPAQGAVQPNWLQLPPQTVVIVGHQMSWAEKAAYDANHWLDDQLESTSDYWKAAEDTAVQEHNPFKYVGAHIMGLLGQAGNSLEHTAVGAFKLATSADAQLNAVRTIGSALTHPGDTATAIYAGAQKFASMPIGEQGDALFKFGVETLVTLGAGKAVTFAGDVALVGAARAVDAVGSAVDAVTGGSAWGASGRTAADLGSVGSTSAVDATLMKSAGVPNTGVAVLDAPAVNSSSFAQKMDAIRRAGFEVVVDPTLEARGEFSVGKFTYNPDTMTRVDMAHEWRHFNQLQQMVDRGIKLNNNAFGVSKASAEFGAYSYEESLWTRIGATPSGDYLAFHNSQLDTFESGLGAFRSFAAKPYNAKWRGIDW